MATIDQLGGPNIVIEQLERQKREIAKLKSMVDKSYLGFKLLKCAESEVVRKHAADMVATLEGYK